MGFPQWVANCVVFAYGKGMREMGHKLADDLAYPPRALRADRAAAYLSMSTSIFMLLVEDGTLPPGIKVRGMVMWDRFELDAAFENMKRRKDDEAERNTVDIALNRKRRQ